MITRLHIAAFLGLAVAAWIALLWLRGTPVAWDHLWPFGLVLSFLAGIYTAFERWWWSWPALAGWFVKRPDLRGTWKATLDPVRDRPGDPVVGYMAVRQSLTTLTMRLMTAESTSVLTAHRIVPGEDHVFRVVGVYTNEPLIHLRGNRSDIHHGAFVLTVEGAPPVRLHGAYWTDRATRGNLILSDRKKIYLASHEAAHEQFGRR